MDTKELGNKIKMVRRSRFLTQGNVADDLGLSITGYANIENGKNNIPFNPLCQIAEYFKISLKNLVAWNDDIPDHGSLPDELIIMDKDESHYPNDKIISGLHKEIAYLKQLLKKKDKIIALLETGTK